MKVAASSVGGKRRARGWAGPPKLSWLRPSPSSLVSLFCFLSSYPSSSLLFFLQPWFPSLRSDFRQLPRVPLSSLPAPTVPLPFSVPLTVSLVPALLLQVSLHLYPLTLELSTPLSFLPPSLPPHLILQSGGGSVGFRHHETNVPRLVTKEVVSLATESADWGCTALSLTLLLQ